MMRGQVIDFPPPPLVAAYHAMNRAIQHHWNLRTEEAREEMEHWRTVYHEECDKAGWPA